ncbi:MAG TPA: VWA domain-containing protein [Pirellulales bacterium]|nr:VWA domain-containing protein [Pirellulales bacterium]
MLQRNDFDIRFLRLANIRLSLPIVFASLLCCGMFALRAFAAEPQSPPREVQRTALRQMRSSKAKLRVEGVARLEEYPTADAARLLSKHGLTSPFEDVRHASYRTLLGEVDRQEVCEVLAANVEKSLRKSAAEPAVCGMLGVLLASELEPVQEQTAKLLALAARQPGAGWEVLTALADELGSEGGARSVKSLVTLSEQPLFGQIFAARRAVVQALTRIESPEAIDALIAILSRVQGEVRGDIAKHLTAVTGQPHALDANRWSSWWKANREKYASRSLRPQSAYGPLRAAAPSHYYGLPIYAQSVVFVLDTSGSMSGLRLAAAERELLQAIASLPAGVAFNVLAFNTGVIPWQAQMAPATPQAKAEAAAFVMLQQASGATWSFEALEAALLFDAEAIYFLTDGEPSGGTNPNPIAIVAMLTQQNRSRRVTINTIGVGVGIPGSPFDLFLGSLASLNYGEYRRVDQ